MKPVFVTGNQHKADYLARLLGMPIDHQKVELDEIQSLSLREIAEHKARQAYQKIGRPVLIDDVGLTFEALGELPGPFIRFFVDAPHGLENLCCMLDGFSTRRATAECVMAYFDGDELGVFHGSLSGEIATSPRGDNGYGWDKIFIPDGFGGKTRAELNESDDEKSYRIIKPIDAVREFLEKRVQQ